MKKILLFICLQLVIDSELFGNISSVSGLFPKEEGPAQTIHQNLDTTYRIIKIPNDGYGYEIWISQKAVIRQLSIPGIPGTTGFSKKKDAKKTARLVLKKMRLGITFPSVEKMELDKLKIDY